MAFSNHAECGHHTAYHEFYHYLSNGGEYERGYEEMEEVMAESSALALSTDASGNRPIPSYPKQLVTYLPRLKHNTEAFKDCNSVMEVGRVAMQERLKNKNRKWSKLHRECHSERLPAGYYKQYADSMQSQRDRLVAMMVEQDVHISGRSRAELYPMYEAGYDRGAEAIRNGINPSTLRGNDSLITCQALAILMCEEGIK